MRTFIPQLFIIALFVLFLAPFVNAGVLTPELTAVLSDLDATEEVAVIVTLVDQVDVASIKGKSRSERRSKIIRALKEKSKSQQPLVALMNKRGARHLKKFWIFNGFAFSGTPEQVHELATRSDIGSIRLDELLEAPTASTSAAANPEWNLTAISAPTMWSFGFDGSGIVVASMDTGIDGEHPDLSANWRGGNNSWFDPHGEYSAPYDSNGHGTQSMGVMVGGEAGGTAIGVAPGAQWIAVKMFNDAGDASFSAIHQGFQWLLDPDGDPGTNDAPDVVNNSWGLRSHVDICVSEFEADVQTLKAADIAVVFSAGNEGPLPQSSLSPANYPESVAVGAVDSNLNIVNSSSRGPSACDGSLYPELAAPGLNIRTADLTFGGLFPDSYAVVSGTSFAAPHVSGSIALLRGAFPSLSVTQIGQALAQSAMDLGQSGPDNDFGNGMIDPLAAFNLLLNPGGCSDVDADGYFAEADCGTEVDCNDVDATINPAACDIKRDGIDQDCDGSDRTKGKSCPVSGSDDGGGSSAGGSEGKGQTCSDGIDNDGDILIDCADPDCSRNKQCR